MPHVLERCAAALPGDPLRGVDPPPRSPFLRRGVVEQLRRGSIESSREPEHGLWENRLSPSQRVIGRSADAGVVEQSRERNSASLAAPPDRLVVELHVDNVLSHGTLIKRRIGGAAGRVTAYIASVRLNSSKKFTTTSICSAVRSSLVVRTMMKRPSGVTS